jgi:hypothetical protein
MFRNARSSAEALSDEAYTSDNPPTIGEFHELLKKTTDMARAIELPYVTHLLMQAEEEIMPLVKNFHSARQNALLEPKH